MGGDQNTILGGFIHTSHKQQTPGVRIWSVWLLNLNFGKQDWWPNGMKITIFKAIVENYGEEWKFDKQK